MVEIFMVKCLKSILQRPCQRMRGTLVLLNQTSIPGPQPFSADLGSFVGTRLL